VVDDAWSALLETMTIEGPLLRSSADQLDAFEQQAGVRLPASYRSFCRVFGPGTLGSWYEFAAPGYGYQPERWNLASKSAHAHATSEWEEYAPDPAQFGRAIIFAGDEATGAFLFDPAAVTDPAASEYAVFAVWRDLTTERVSDTFAEFVAICLHRGGRTLYDEAPPLTYRAPWQGSPAWPKRKHR
jgi:hypothetical protein